MRETVTVTVTAELDAVVRATVATVVTVSVGANG